MYSCLQCPAYSVDYLRVGEVKQELWCAPSFHRSKDSVTGKSALPWFATGFGTARTLINYKCLSYMYFDIFFYQAKLHLPYLLVVILYSCAVIPVNPRAT